MKIHNKLLGFCFVVTLGGCSWDTWKDVGEVVLVGTIAAGTGYYIGKEAADADDDYDSSSDYESGAYDDPPPPPRPLGTAYESDSDSDSGSSGYAGSGSDSSDYNNSRPAARDMSHCVEFEDNHGDGWNDYFVNNCSTQVWITYKCTETAADSNFGPDNAFQFRPGSRHAVSPVCGRGHADGSYDGYNMRWAACEYTKESGYAAPQWTGFEARGYLCK